MKTNTLLTIGSAILAIFLLVGCNNDDYLPSDKKLLPSEIVYYLATADPSHPSSSEFTYTYSYDSQNRIIKTETIIKDAHGNASIFVTKLTYNGDDIIVTENRSDDPNISKIITYKHEGSQIIVEGEEPILIDDKLRIVGPIYDQSGNTIKRSGVKYGYDKENGVFRHVNMPHWYLTTSIAGIIGNNIFNNCRKENKDETGYSYIMKYNSDNYPTSIIREPIESTLGGSLIRYSIKYNDAN